MCGIVSDCVIRSYLLQQYTFTTRKDSHIDSKGKTVCQITHLLHLLEIDPSNQFKKLYSSSRPYGHEMVLHCGYKDQL